MPFVGDTMLEDEPLLLLPTEEDLPDSDEKPVDNELQVLAPVLLRAILTYIWSDRFDWFFGINLGVYYDENEPAMVSDRLEVIGPDGFLSLGVARVRPNGKLRRSYVLKQEKVMPQWVLEVVSKKPGGEYGEKVKSYAAMGVLYYVIYNPTHYVRDKHEAFEVYKLKKGKYVRQRGNPVWMPEIGLGIGHEFGTQDDIERDWLYWYDESGNRYPAPADILKQERILRGREQLMRQQLEAELAQERNQRLEGEQARIQVQQELAKEAQARRSLLQRQLTRKVGAIDDRTLAKINALPTDQLESLGEDLLDFGSIDDLTVWIDNQA
jgi:Uma2 family endonuclease